jgi:hypothetical protein
LQVASSIVDQFAEAMPPKLGADFKAWAMAQLPQGQQE